MGVELNGQTHNNNSGVVNKMAPIMFHSTRPLVDPMKQKLIV